MSASDLIATATVSVCAHLRGALAGLPGTPEVVAGPPWKAPEHGICVHLHTVAEAPHLRNQALPETGAVVALRLRYLLSFFGPDDVRVHRLAGRTLEAIRKSPVLSGTSLAQDGTGLEGTGLEGVDLSHSPLRLALDPLGIEEMTSLWERFRPMRYALSLGLACEIAG